MEYIVLPLLSVLLVTGQSKADQSDEASIQCTTKPRDYEYTFRENSMIEVDPHNKQCNISIKLSNLPDSVTYITVGQDASSCSGEASIDIRASSDQTQPALYTAALCNNSIARNFGVFYQFSDTLFLHIVTYESFHNKIQLEATTMADVQMKQARMYLTNNWLPAAGHSTGPLDFDFSESVSSQLSPVNYTITLRVPTGHSARLAVSADKGDWTYSNESGDISEGSRFWSTSYITISCRLARPQITGIQASYRLWVTPLYTGQTTTAATFASTSVTAAFTTVVITTTVTDTVATTAATRYTAASTAAVSTTTTSLTAVPISPPSKTPTATASSIKTSTLTAVIGGNSGANTEKNNTVVVAVAVTVVVVFLLILAIVIFLYKRRRTKKSEPSLSMSTCGDRENNCYEIESRDTAQEHDMDNVYLDIVPDSKLPVGSKAKKQATSYEDASKSARQSHPYAAIGNEVVFSLPGNSQQQAIAQVDNDIYHQTSASEENKDPSTQESYSVYHLAEAFDEPKPEEKNQVSNEDADYIILEDPVDNALENPNYPRLSNALHHALEDPDYHTLENPESNMLENPNYGKLENHEHRTLDSHEYHILENPALVAGKTAKKTPP